MDRFKILLSRVPESGKIHIVQSGVIREKELVLAEWQKTLFLRSESPETRGWLLDVMKCVESLGKRDFTLDEVYAFERHLLGRTPRSEIAMLWLCE
jgi:type II restriction enzyme